jgi:hypothetical protein
MKVLENGAYRDMTPEEFSQAEGFCEVPTRKEAIVSAIREHYSLDDEIAILRQRDTKPDEFDEYFKFVEGVKESLKAGETDG